MKILLMDSAFSSLPIYDSLINQGHDVWTIGNRKDDLLAVRAGEKWLPVNYSDIQAVRECLEALSFDAVVPGCTDVSYNVCSRLGGDWFRGDSPHNNYIINNKYEFRKLCTDLNIPSPRLFHKTSFPSPGNFICKPVDSYSGRGVTIFNGESLGDLESAVSEAKKFSHSGDFLIESFHDGQLYSCSAFIVKHEVKDSFYVIESSSANKFAVDTSFVSESLSPDLKKSIEDDLCSIARHMDLSDGLLHTQFILSEERFYFIEMTRRCPGDLYSRLIELSTGFPYASAYVGFFIGANYKRIYSHRKFILRHTLSTTDHGVYRGIKFHLNPSFTEFYSLSKLGDILHPNQKTRAGILFMGCDTQDELNFHFNALVAREAYDLI